LTNNLKVFRAYISITKPILSIILHILSQRNCPMKRLITKRKVSDLLALNSILLFKNRTKKENSSSLFLLPDDWLMTLSSCQNSNKLATLSSLPRWTTTRTNTCNINNKKNIDKYYNIFYEVPRIYTLCIENISQNGR